MDVSNLDIQHIDEDEASEDLSVVERELNDDYQPKSIFMNPQQFKDSASTGTVIQLWWLVSLMKLAISSLQCRY